MNCDDYFEDPDRNAAHLQSCQACRVMAGELDSRIEIESRPLSVDALPMASWEGSSYKTWPLVAAGVVAVLALAMALFIAAGTPPLRGIAHAVASSVASFEAASKFVQLFGTGLHSAPAVVHVTVAVLFVVINTLLVVLLRRSPKGIDV